jgi:2,3-bisphosphoglycerate-dependent phosphoglycerate mutase
MAPAPLHSQIERRRRRRLRLIPLIGYAIVALGLAYFFEQRPSTTVVFVRHTDTDQTVDGDDPPLSPRGRQRAEVLADFLQDIDVVAGVDHIFVGHNKRTEQTAAPLAARLMVPVEARDQKDVPQYMRYVMRHHAGEIVLVIADGDAIPAMIDELHGSKRLPPFDPSDYDEVYIVTSPWYGKVKTLRLHYGASKGFAISEPSAASGG